MIRIDPGVLGQPGVRNNASMAEDTSHTQLRLIGEVHGLLSGAGIPHWLFGGWAVDFHVGAVTREHGDIEFFIWEHDGPRAAEVLAAADYRPVQHPHPEEASIWRKDGTVVELYFNAVNEGGEVVGRGRWDNWPTPDGALGDDVRVLEGVKCPVVSRACILHVKLDYARHTGIGPRGKDRADVEELRRAES
jgi:hypothetical protein